MSDPQWVLLDTDVWTAIYLRRDSQDPRARVWRKSLAGCAVAVPTQVRAEVLAGIAASDWGEPRRRTASEALDATATVPVSADVVTEYANLYGECRRAGHPLHEKIHTGDRWIAATARATGLPLLSGDQLYQDAPGVELWLGGEADLVTN